MGCCDHEHKTEDQKAEGCCGGAHKHKDAKPESGMKWWKKLIPASPKKSCCGDKEHCH